MSDNKNNEGNKGQKDMVFVRPVKTDPGPSSGSPVRLPSLKKPDFTLKTKGGVPKKTFVPNLTKKKTTKKRSAVSGAPKNDKSEKKDKSSSLKIQGKARIFNKKEYIQGTSLFTGGSGATASPRAGGSSFRRASSSSSLAERKPLSVKRSIRNVIIKTENNDSTVDDGNTELEELDQRTTEEVLEDLEKEAGPFIDDIECDWNQQPVNVLLRPNLSDEAGVKKLKDVKPMELKTEPGLDSDTEDERPLPKEAIRGEKCMLIRMPSTFPISSASADFGRMSIKEERDDSQEESEKKQNLGKGHIGKLQILKSGKCRLVIGEVVFDLQSGLHPQNLMAASYINTKPKETGEGAMGSNVNFGEVINTSTCVLNVERYL